MSLSLSAGTVRLTSLSCGNQHVWACDSRGGVYFRVGTQPLNPSLMLPAWIMIEPPVQVGNQLALLSRLSGCCCRGRTVPAQGAPSKWGPRPGSGGPGTTVCPRSAHAPSLASLTWNSIFVTFRAEQIVKGYLNQHLSFFSLKIKIFCF